MTRSKKMLKKTGKAALVLVLVMLTANGVLRFCWGRQVEARLTALKASGQPMSFAQLQGQLVPDSLNAAPVYEQAFTLMREPTMQNDVEAVCKICYSSQGEPSQADWDNAKAAIVRCDKIFALIDEADSRPECQYAMDMSFAGDTATARAHALTDTLGPRYATLRKVARLICAKALLSAREGDSAGVVSSMESALKLPVALGEHPLLIGHLVNVAVTRITLANLRNAMGYCTLDEAQLRKLDSMVSQINLDEQYKTALAGERVYFLQIDWEMKKNGVAVVWPLSYADTAAYLDLVARQMDSIGMSYSEARSKGCLPDDPQSSVPFYATLTKVVAPAYVRAGAQRYTVDAEVACCRASLALAAYKGKHGAYPQTLAQLKSAMEWDVPSDPFTGKELMYRPNGFGFTVYSLGPNQRDEGGTVAHAIGARSNADDIIWKMER